VSFNLPFNVNVAPYLALLFLSAMLVWTGGGIVFWVIGLI